MPWYDLPLDQLRTYRLGTEEPPGLDQWWAERLDEARALTKPVTLTRHEPELYAPLEVYDAEFSGAGGDRIKAWYITPPKPARPEAAIVRFIGYGGGRGAPAEHALLAALGYAVFVMDIICPPSTVFAAYNEITSGKDIAVYPYSGHTVPNAHAERQFRHLRKHFPLTGGDRA